MLDDLLLEHLHRCPIPDCFFCSADVPTFHHPTFPFWGYSPKLKLKSSNSISLWPKLNTYKLNAATITNTADTLSAATHFRIAATCSSTTQPLDVSKSHIESILISQSVHQSISQSISQPANQPNCRRPQQSFIQRTTQCSLALCISHTHSNCLPLLATLPISPNSFCRVHSLTHATCHMHSILRLFIFHATISHVA